MLLPLGLWMGLLPGCASRPRADTPEAVTSDQNPARVVRPGRPQSPPPAAPAPASAAAPGVSFTQQWAPIQSWARTQGFGAPKRLSGETQPGYALTTPKGVLTTRAGSHFADWNGMEVCLGFAPRIIDGRFCLNALDLQKTVQPLMDGFSGFRGRTRPIIVIDAGHGGDDAGTRSVLDRRCEKEFTLDWALRLRALLLTNGWRVYLTRSNDATLSISNRVLISEERRADLFVSLHFNSSAPNQAESGLETYCLTPTGMPSNLTRGFLDDTSLSFPNNHFDMQNFQLALLAHRSLLRVNGNHDRGVRRARFPGVLRGQNRPAILLEGGFLSNPKEAALIATPAYRQKLAEALALALGGCFKPAPESVQPVSARN